ncbi:MAG: hypothetical protein COA63_013965 [Methylophaga sp.]|nr:hypothetical protein [Methylophaga sp.]
MSLEQQWSVDMKTGEIVECNFDNPKEINKFNFLYYPNKILYTEHEEAIEISNSLRVNHFLKDK